MANLLDYLRWRGDLPLRASPFNAVDSLILSVLAYVPFDGVVPPSVTKKGPTIAEAAAALLETGVGGSAFRDENDLLLLSALAASERFGGLRLCAYENVIDFEREKQFAAVTALTGDGHAFVAYRGTDHTLVGWKEDFNMSFMTPVPAQEAAVAYLERVAAGLRTRLRLGGHSKGGNLAVYAASFCRARTQRRVRAVYNNDGPGFDTVVIAKEGYRNVQDRLFSFVPQSSIIGMLLEHDERYTVVQSDESGLMQHDPYSWNVLGTGFITVQRVTDESRFIDRTLKEWVGAMEPAKRELFIDAVFDVLSSTDAKTFSELGGDWLKSSIAVAKTLHGLDEPTRKVMFDAIKLLAKAIKNSLPEIMQASASGKDPKARRRGAGSGLTSAST
jgi:hypothetical protein